jgi:hypothetical protein
METQIKGNQSSTRIYQWKNYIKRILLVVAFIMQLIHVGQELQSLKKPPKSPSTKPQQALFMLKQCFTFNCQLMVSLSNNQRKAKRKNYSKPRSTNETV